MRSEFSAKTMTQAFLRCGGRCEECGIKLFDGEAKYHEFDHGICCGLGGSNDLANCVVLCRTCHRAKTTKDVKNISKAKRRERAHAGIKRASKFPCSRNSPWKKKITGEVVRR